MKSCSSEILSAWYNLLDGNVSYDGTTIPVYRVTADPNANSHFILLIPDNETNRGNNQILGKDFFLRVDIVTKLYDQVNDGIVDSIDNQINELLIPTDWNSTAIKETASFNITDITPQSASYAAEQYETTRYYVKRTLYKHIVGHK